MHPVSYFCFDILQGGIKIPLMWLGRYRPDLRESGSGLSVPGALVYLDLNGNICVWGDETAVTHLRSLEDVVEWAEYNF